jgi:hypothetical protein
VRVNAHTSIVGKGIQQRRSHQQQRKRSQSEFRRRKITYLKIIMWWRLTPKFSGIVAPSDKKSATINKLQATVRRPYNKLATMKMTYIIIGIILAGGLVFYLISCGNKSIANDNKQLTTDQDTTKAKVHHTKENAFEGLRNMAFTATPEQLGLSLSSDKTIVYGIIMDWEMSGATATTVSYQTGDASLYLSSGGGVIGGGQHQNVNSAAKQFVSLAQTFLDKTTKTETTPLPSTNEVKFYLLTNKGVFVGQEQMKNFENNSSPWLKLFEEGNNVLTELRKTSEK